MPVPCCAAKNIKLLSGIICSCRCPCIHSSRCPCHRVGRHPLAAQLAYGPMHLRLQIPQGDVLIGRCSDIPIGRVPAMPSLQSVVHQGLDRENKRLLIDGEANAL
eukprot:135645-Pyramimonas_sp.AAC.1